MRRETISAIRYGYGLAPGRPVPGRVDEMVQAAAGTSRTAPRETLRTRASLILAYRDARKMGEDATKAARRKLLQTAGQDMRHFLAEAVTDPGFGARLVAFWSDHFTVASNGPLLRILVPAFIDDAIRPHIAGHFPDMLRAVVKHPAMLIYLNQVQSVGPNSRAGQRRDRGLNENLAREILELHTLGVGGAYFQDDVRAFAELLTGLSVEKAGFLFRPNISEPGPHAVLGKRYGGVRSTLADIEAALVDIALHPDTARHLATKLVTHFIGVVDGDHVARIAAAYIASEGDLTATYAALLDDDRAWEPTFHKAKLPFDFIASAIRAAGGTASDVARMTPGDLRSGVIGAMQLMGQPPFSPPGPDGWDEAPEAWITPPGIAARIRWATAFAERIEATHDPRDFLQIALGDAATPVLSFAVGGSESRVEGLALTLVSPEFNRR